MSVKSSILVKCGSVVALVLSASSLWTNLATAEVQRPIPEEVSDDPFSAMEQFSRCVARFETVALLHLDENKPATAEEYSGAARGSKAVAQFFASIVDLDAHFGTDSYQEKLSLRLDQVTAFYDIEMIRQAGFIERGTIDLEGFKYCLDLQPLQIQTIEVLRRGGVF